MASCSPVSTAHPRAWSCRGSMHGRARSGCAASSSQTPTSLVFGSATDTTTPAIRGKSSATGATTELGRAPLRRLDRIIVRAEEADDLRLIDGRQLVQPRPSGERDL